jgi:hypothetical protein
MKATNGENSRARIWFALVVVGLALLLTVVVLIFNEAPKGPLAEAVVDDGRIIVIEAVTYGTNHVVGNTSPHQHHHEPGHFGGVAERAGCELPDERRLPEVAGGVRRRSG